MATSGTDGPKRRPRTKRVDPSHEQRHFDIALGDEANEGLFSRSLYGIIEKSEEFAQATSPFSVQSFCNNSFPHALSSTMQTGVPCQ